MSANHLSNVSRALVAPLAVLAMAWLPTGFAAQARSDARPILGDASREQVEAERVGEALMHVDPEVREEAVRALAEAAPTLALPVLQRALVDVDTRVRSVAVDALADVGGDAAADVLALALVDPVADVREDAVYALARLGGDLARANVVAAQQDPAVAVRDAARQALEDWAPLRRRR
jgi:HEAT repeat protein